MSIKVKYIYNTQAIEVAGSKGKSWVIATQNERKFNYLNARLNNKPVYVAPLEMQEAWYGNY